MFGGMKNMADLMKLVSQAGKIKENMAQAQERAKNRSVSGESGGGAVKVSANGAGEILSVQIDAETLKDPETLGPLITAAVNVALQKSKEVMMEEASTAMGGVELPPGIV